MFKYQNDCGLIFVINKELEVAARIDNVDKHYIFDANMLRLTARDLREIADKIDELNGVKLSDSGA